MNLIKDETVRVIEGAYRIMEDVYSNVDPDMKSRDGQSGIFQDTMNAADPHSTTWYSILFEDGQSWWYAAECIKSDDSDESVSDACACACP